MSDGFTDHLFDSPPHCLQVTIHGHEKCDSLFLSSGDLNDSEYLKEAAAAFPIPPPLSQTKELLQRQVMG